MKKTETYTKDVYYCDICGAVIENNTKVPYTTTHYQALSEYSNEPIECEHEVRSKCLHLCGYHNRILGALMTDCVKEVLSFLNNKRKLSTLLKQREIRDNTQMPTKENVEQK